MYCPAPVVDYSTVRSELRQALAGKASEAKAYVSKMHKAQQAAEDVLDMWLPGGHRGTGGRDRWPCSCL